MISASHRTPVLAAMTTKVSKGNKSVRKSIKMDKVANQLKAIEMLEEARQYEDEGNLEEAVRYYEIAQDHLPTPSADLRVNFSLLHLSPSSSSHCS
jgi:outer membrane protein assembly factor BamD (BamD/ComL family)